MNVCPERICKLRLLSEITKESFNAQLMFLVLIFFLVYVLVKLSEYPKELFYLLIE